MSQLKLNTDFTESFDSLSIKSNASQLKNNGKPKRKNSEKRKEKSRKAARERRSQEAKIFDQIEAILPIPVKAISHLDKASLVRLAINFLKIRKVVQPIENICKSKYTEYENQLLNDDFSAIKAMNGFIFVLSKEGDMVYLSESVEKYLGLTQIDLMGQSIYDFSHPCDHNDIKEVLAQKNSYSSNSDLSLINDNQIASSFFVRMKCTLTNKGRNLNLKSAAYKVIHCSGHLLSISDSNNSSNDPTLPSTQTSRNFLVTIGELIEHPYTIEKSLSLNVFVSRHSPDMKYTDVDDRIQKILGYNHKELTGKSIFNFFHALDLPQLEKFFKTLFAKGQSESGYYRFLAKSGGHLWLSTQATIITDSHSSQPQSVICVNHVISGIESEFEITSEEQCFEEESVETLTEIEVDKIVCEERLDPPQTSFVSSTKTVFAPKTADMESGFLVFTDDANGMTILSDAEDLTHLAPEAGDICIPMPGLLGMDFNDMNFFDDIFFNQNGCNPNIFSDDEKLKLNDENLQFNCSSDIQNSNTDDVFKDKDESEGLIGKHNESGLYRSVTQNFIKNYPNVRDNESVEDSPLPNDPFLSYHEEMFSSSPSTDSSDPYSSKSNSPINISSPILSQTSNYFCKSPTCEEVSKLNISDTNDFIDDKILEMRAPFIPIDEDFPLLLNDDLQMPYSSTNIDELINFDNLPPNKPINSSDSTKKASLIFDNGMNGQQSGCLEMLLQSDSPLKTKKLNLNQTTKQNLENNAIQININAINSNLMKCDNISMPLNKVQLVYNMNQTTNAQKGGSIGKNITNECLIKINGTDCPQLMLGSNKANRIRFSDKAVPTERIIIKKNDFVKPLNANKRPYSTETPEIFYSICPNDILSNGRSSKGFVKESQVQKRIKVNNLDTNNQGNSVLMNLLVNGEDVTNGYSKYSNIDRVNQSSNFNMNNTIYQKFSNSKKNTKHNLLFEGQDIR